MVILGSFDSDSKLNRLISEEGIKFIFKIKFEKLLIKKTENIDKTVFKINFLFNGIIKKNVPINSPSNPFLEFVKKIPKIINVVNMIEIIFLFVDS